MNEHELFLRAQAELWGDHEGFIAAADHIARLEAELAKRAGKCRWVYWYTSDSGIRYRTDCGKIAEKNSDRCPNCGKEIEVVQ